MVVVQCRYLNVLNGELRRRVVSVEGPAKDKEREQERHWEGDSVTE